MKKQMRKAMLSTMCMLVVGIMCLTGVTYAWFSAGTDATVNQFDVTVEDSAGGYIMISADSDTLSFGSSVTPTVTNGNLMPASATNALSTTNNTMSFFTAAGAQGKTTISNIAAASAGSNYKTFDLYLYNSGTSAAAITLSEINVQAQADNANTTDVVEGKTNTTELSTRVAFVPFASTTYSGLAKSTYSTTTLATGVTVAKIYEPNASTHTANGQIEQGINTSTQSPTGKYTYYGIDTAPEENAATTEVARYADNDYLSEVTTADSTDGLGTIVTIAAQSVVRLTVYVWIEGQDVDCQNDVAGYGITARFKFNATTVTES